MKYNLYAIILLLLSTVNPSCKRQDLVDQGVISNGSIIPVTIDWSLSSLNYESIENVSLYAYPKDEGNPYLKISGNIDSLSITLPQGVYSLLLINDAIEDIQGVNFFNQNNYTEFTANSTTDSTTSRLFYEPQLSEVVAQEMNGVAAWRIDEFEVSDSMVCCQYCGEIHPSYTTTLHNIQPQPVTAICTVKLYVENLSSSQIIQGVLRGFASGAYLASNNRIESTSTNSLYSINFNNYIYDDPSNPESGSVSSTIFNFGKEPQSGSSYEVELQVILNNGELMTFQRDVTSQVDSSGDFSIYIELTDSTNKIVLPDNLASGFGVDSWGENEQIELK